MSEADLIRVLLVDDDEEMQQIISTLLERTTDIQLVGVGNDGRKALDLCRLVRPNVILLDIMMPVMDGIEAAGLLREQDPQVRILVVSSVCDAESVQAMLANGVDGYINKSHLVRDLVETIRVTYHGKKVFSSEVLAYAVRPSTQPGRQEFDLTEREREVLGLMAKGLSNAEIAMKLGIAQSTVKYYVDNLFQKCKVRKRSELMIWAAKNGLV